MSKRVVTACAACAICLMVAVAFRLFCSGGFTADSQILELRGARIVIALVVGAALAVGGVYLQCLLRNPLASPDFMGLASGAGLAVMIGEYVRRTTSADLQGSFVTTGFLALAGSGGSLGVIWVLARRSRGVDPVSLILTGVIVGLVCSAGSMLLQHVMPGQGESTRRWLLGSLDETAPRVAIWAAAVACAVFGAWGMAWSRRLDAMTLAEDEARSLGVNVARTRAFLFLGAGILAACAVVLSGPVGFVGLIAPHMARLAAGPAHRTLILLAALCGALLVVAADGAVKALDLPAGRLPLGVITTFIGGPVLISMLRRAR